MKVNGPKYRLTTSYCIDQTIKQLVYGVLIYLPMQVLQVTGQKSDKSPPFSSVLHIMTSNPIPNAFASTTKAHLSEKSSQLAEVGYAIVLSLHNLARSTVMPRSLERGSILIATNLLHQSNKEQKAV